MEREGDNKTPHQSIAKESGDATHPAAAERRRETDARPAVAPHAQAAARVDEERGAGDDESEKMRSLGQLAAGVAHDFNNSLAAILGRTQLLLRTATDERQRRDLQIIETAALDAAEAVRRIQNFARRMPPGAPRIVHLTRLISDAIQLTRTRWETDARAHGIRYEVECAPCDEGDDEIAANPSELREVLVNLILNALDAMPRGGRLSFVVSRHSSFVAVAVEDTGGGIASEVRGRIFEPFFTTKGAQGSGLGLAISRGIVRRHGGTIEVESEVGHGTTFTLRFPHARGALVARPEARVELRAHRVLVVDDDDVVREVLVELLRELKQEVTEASGAHEALAHLSKGNFDLMITDLSMPVMDGLQLAAGARQAAPAMRVVLVTGYGQLLPGNRRPDPSLVDAVLNKPFQLSDLEASLRALLGDETETR
ncbi:MAG TPA: ATP-binding protein [Pyrinomonadaceae bacterium]|jgi:signal transduction histidine kinase/ActR/RegA family two-component response regulator|nr:ATP-binding protein [Pyrinomonadaceae bacterium]